MGYEQLKTEKRQFEHFKLATVTDDKNMPGYKNEHPGKVQLFTTDDGEGFTTAQELFLKLLSSMKLEFLMGLFKMNWKTAGQSFQKAPVSARSHRNTYIHLIPL